MDWPQNAALPTHIHSCGTFSAAIEVCGVLSAAVGVFNWPATDRALYLPLTIPWAYPVARVFWANGSTPTGNMDFGLYTVDGGKIITTGKVAQSGASALQYVDVTDFVLPAGQYYMALANDSATTTSRGWGINNVATEHGRIAGCLQQATASPLPATATFAAWASTGYPLCGITRTASGF